MGASLLAMRPFQSTMMLNVSPLSRAGSLPHWFGVYSVGFARRALKNSLSTAPHSSANTPPSNNTR
ncbi:hypothetical protein EJA72_05355 [Pseudomonas sp. PB120]|nr:hypothetical protein [Pseudomonas sp. PB120]